ncbi:hypothetical protein AYO49_04575 [Verrucomicrobiaceae bacterium SCGC AG-212-N21]|nr:hypothetical protein AYO49_04575 [Verrucomicrobiaceae bacterium SCGC AG-212-N21]
MARLDDFLARWLLRRLKRKPVDGAVSALAEHAEEKRVQLERLNETAGKRAHIHQELKKRHRQLKREFKAMKEQARTNQHESWKWETECRVLRERMKAYEQELAGKLEQPGAAAPPLQNDARTWSLFLNLRRSVWKYPMRLGVLRQHEPKPMVRERFRKSSPPGPPESWPRMSIVTPSFQQAAFLERTMRSVLDQDYPHLEYRVCDGGSTDGSVEIIRRHEARLAGWHSEPDHGPASAINKGLGQAGGDVMGWLNSDDLLMPGAVRFVADYFARHPDVDAVYGHRVVIDDRDWEVGRWVLPRHDGEMQLWGDYIPQETLFWRRSLWNRVDARLDESFKFAFDWDLLLRFQKAGARIVRLPWFLGFFRVHDAQKSTAEISTTGIAEMARLRERELGVLFQEDRLGRKVVLFQRKAVWCDRLLRWGVRW